MSVWNSKMAGHQAASGQVFVNSAFTWSLLLCNAYQSCSSNEWVLQHHFVYALDMCTLKVLVYFGCSSNGIAQWPSGGNPVLICIIGAQWKTIAATSTLGCHWHHTGWCEHPVVSQWQSSVNLHDLNTLEDHWNITGRPVEAHWKHTGYPKFFLQWHRSVHWGPSSRHTGLPLNSPISQRFSPSGEQLEHRKWDHEL